MNDEDAAARAERLRSLEQRKLALTANLARKTAYLASHPSSKPAPSTKVARRPAKAGTEMPADIAENPALLEAIAKTLPPHYNFEVQKTLWRIRRVGAKRVALQLPEGLLLFACGLADLLETFGGCERPYIMADVTYGACCVDDYSAAALGCDLLVHYGHSCLVPIDEVKKTTGIDTMYVFVDVFFDATHLVESIKLEFESERTTARLALLGTIQFSGGALHQAKKMLDAWFTHPVAVPRERPLSGGEVLGCTSPVCCETKESDPEGRVTGFVFIADGRFHMESTMIANPDLPAYRYDPYAKTLSLEGYDHLDMMAVRRAHVEEAARAQRFGLVMGTLGRQGNVQLVHRLQTLLRDSGKEFVLVLLSELTPSKLALLEERSGIQAWIQVACPRLSIDWGRRFKRPLLSSYEAYVALGQQTWKEVYPQDFYAKNGGPWTNYYKPPTTV